VIRVFLSFVLFFGSLSTAESVCRPDVVKLDKLSDYSYVLVPGIFNEFISFYLTEYKNFLLENGVPKEQIIRFNSSSFEYPVNEAERLSETLEKFPSDKPLIFFTHSKGSLETLYMLKDFDLSRVHHVYLIQSPLDGISSHEIFYGSILDEDPAAMKIVKKIMKWSLVSDRYEYFSKRSVRPKVAESLKVSGLLDKLTFVVSETDYEGVPFKLKLMGGIYQFYYDELGDGVVLKKDQLPYNLDQEKTCVLDIPGNHGMFVRASPWQTERVNLIHSFVKYLLTDRVSPVVF